MRRCVLELICEESIVIVDGNMKIPEIDDQRQIVLVKGYDKSALVPSIPISKHKGYGAKDYINRVKEFGLSPIHRRTFCKNWW